MAVRDLVDPGGLRDINPNCLDNCHDEYLAKCQLSRTQTTYAIANQIFSHMFLGRGGG
jgi:hypothetical protein